MSKENIICGCLNITEETIIQAINNGAETVKDIGVVTEASTVCGTCKSKIQEVIDQINLKAKKIDNIDNNEDQIICGCLGITENEIMRSIENGAKSINDISKVTKASTICGACKESIQEVIDKVKPGGKIICACQNVTEEEIIKAIQDGATTVAMVGKSTEAGTWCKSCKGAVQEIIDDKADKIICACLDIKESTIIKAVENGAKTINDVAKVTKASTICGACKELVQEVIDKVKPEGKIICRCNNITEETVINAIKNGARTVEAVGKETDAGTWCGNCKEEIQHIIDDINPEYIETETETESKEIKIETEMKSEEIQPEKIEIGTKDEEIESEIDTKRINSRNTKTKKEENKGILNKMKSLFK